MYEHVTQTSKYNCALKNEAYYAYCSASYFVYLTNNELLYVSVHRDLFYGYITLHFILMGI